MLQVVIDRGLCQGAGECVHIAPATFHLDDTVTAVAADPAGDIEELILEAAESCPNGAISIVRTNA